MDWLTLCFYALGVGLGFATAVILVSSQKALSVSMPSVSGWALRRRSSDADGSGSRSFYALGVGLGFATDALRLSS
jgi:hypothetical protein